MRGKASARLAPDSQGTRRVQQHRSRGAQTQRSSASRTNRTDRVKALRADSSRIQLRNDETNAARRGRRTYLQWEAKREIHILHRPIAAVGDRLTRGDLESDTRQGKFQTANMTSGGRAQEQTGDTWKNQTTTKTSRPKNPRPAADTVA